MRGIPHNELQGLLKALYSPDCCHSGGDHLSMPSLISADEIEKMLSDLVRRIYEAKGFSYADIDPQLTEFFASQYWKGVVKGFGADLTDVNFDTPDYIMLRKLQENVYQFAAAKNFQQLVALSKELTDDNGMLRSFTDFRTAAYDINNQHVNIWLKAEYNMAVASSQLSANWVRFEENEKEMPLLEFDAIIDSHTTEICLSLNGTVRPLNDDFWNVWYPPNHWGERSTVKQIAGKTLITPLEKIIYPDQSKIPGIFKTNFAKTGVVFPPGHPYYEGMPDQVKEKALELLRKQRGK